MNKYFKIIFLVLIFSQVSLAQNSFVKAGYSSKENAVIIKWFQEKNRFDEGVVIYRKDNVDNNWIKLTDKPVKKPAKLNESEAKAGDKNNAIYNFIIYSNPKDAVEYENWEFTLILQTLLNNDFAKYSGMAFADNKLEAGKKYTYKVSYLRAGSEIELDVSNETGSDDIVAAVNNSLTLAQNNDKIFCNWIAEEDKFISYNIYRGAKKLNDKPVYVFQTEKPQAFLFADSLSAEGTYSYSYTGLDAFGNESALSTAVTLTVTSVSIPPRAVNLRYDGNNQLTLYWNVKSPANLKGFNVFRSNNANGEFTQINSALIPATDTSFTDNTAALDTKYFYYISSENNAGITNSSSVIAALSSDYSKPSVPENLTAVSDSMLINLSWNKSTSPNVIGYKLYRNIRGNENEFLLLTPLPLQETFYTDTLSKGALNDFYYKIVAVNQVYMNSNYSQPVAVKLKDVVPPSAPIITDISYENNIVTITWIRLFEADLYGYKIFRSEDSLSGFTEISSITKEQASFTDNTASIGKTYYYKISSVDNSGNVSQSLQPSNISLISENADVPQMKINLSHNKETNSVDVSWEGIQNPSSPITGYFVVRRDNDEEFSYPLSGILTDLKFIDTTIESPAKYSYSIKIVYENGDILTTSEQLIETN
jgi:fibronectin type 3 domain-containing protein